MHAVNLLPRDAFVVERSRLNLALIGGGATPLIALALVIASYNSAHRHVGSEIAELSVLNAQVAQLAPAKVREEVEQQQANAVTNQLAAERAARLTTLQTILATASPVDTFMAQLGRVMPTNVWLTTLDYTPSSAATSGTFSIGGYTYSENAVAQLMARLQLLSGLSSVTLTSATQTTVGTKNLIQFSVSGTPTAAPAPPVAPTTTTPTTTTASGATETAAP
jgi:Tfp pilus assembly protein PilN